MIKINKKMFDFLSSQGGKFSVIPLFLNLGSGLALLGIVSIQIDIDILFYCFKYSTMCSCAFRLRSDVLFRGAWNLQYLINDFFCRPQFFVTLWFSMYFRRSIFTGRKNICWLMILKVNLMISRYVEVALSCFFSS